MAELEAKQEEILKQLSELKEQILSIKSNLKLNVSSLEKSSISCNQNVSIQKVRSFFFNFNIMILILI